MNRGILDKWYASRDPYKAPEQGFFLIGQTREDRPLENGSVRPAGTTVSTSYVIRSEGKRVWTKSGSEYELGEPDADFLIWLDNAGFAFDPDNPLPVKRRQS